VVAGREDVQLGRDAGPLQGQVREGAVLGVGAAVVRAVVPAELHIFATGDHDFGVRQNDRLPSSWTRLCVNWLRSRGKLAPGPAG
jgi:hypothetical protein